MLRLRVALLAAALLAGVAATASAQPTPAPVDPALLALPSTMSTALVAGDTAVLRKSCAASAYVIDEFAPYVWSGADACARWAAAFKAFAAKMKMGGFKATVSPNPITDVSGSRAYVVAKVKFDGTMAGKPISENGSWTFVAVKSGAGWKITSLAWGTLDHSM